MPKSDKAVAKQILAALARTYPAAVCALVHRNPFELLAATILSAQCTDKRVNMVTPALFDAYPSADALARAELDDVEALVRTTGFFRSKAKNLIGMAQQIVAEHHGEIPRTLAQLIKLPGVARKTANVVLGVAFGLAEGVVVDTHVARVSKRLGLTHSDKPQRIEQDLMAAVPRAMWISLSHRLIEHGRQICDARAPRCSICPLAALCPSANAFLSTAKRRAQLRPAGARRPAGRGEARRRG